MPLIRRRLLGAAILALALVTTGCTGAGDSADDASTSSPSDAFPVIIEHVYGETEITAKPERVVTIGGGTADVVAALGTVPVGIPQDLWSGDDDGYVVWLRDYIEDELGAELPVAIPAGDDGPNYEEILALAPDVILAPGSGLTEVQYQRLSEIAPTVPHAARAYTFGTWQDLTRLVGTVLGEGEAAEDVIARTEEAIADEVAEYPNLTGASFVYTQTLGEDGGTELSLNISEDPRVVFIRSLGLVDSPSLAERTANVADDLWYGGVSLEELDTVDTDLVIAWANALDDIDRTLEHPLVARWEPVANGSYYIIGDRSLSRATMSLSPLSIPWAIQEGYIADLSSAISGGAVVHTAE